MIGTEALASEECVHAEVHVCVCVFCVMQCILHARECIHPYEDMSEL